MSLGPGGRQGRDDLLNGSGNGGDFLFGDTGDPEINEGAGKDLLNGDAGADILVYEAVSDTGVIGGAAFAGGGNAEIRGPPLTNNSRIWIDADCNGSADTMISTLGQWTFDPDDFIPRRRKIAKSWADTGKTLTDSVRFASLAAGELQALTSVRVRRVRTGVHLISSGVNSHDHSYQQLRHCHRFGQ